MPRRIQPSWTAHTRNSIACMGDSLTHNHTLGVWPHEFWVERVAVALRALDCNMQARNFGRSGNTTAQMITRFGRMTEWDTPVVACLWGGTNDATYASTVQASPAPTTSSFSVAAGKGAGYSAGSYAKVNGVSCLVGSVSTDAITLATPLGGAPTAGQTVEPDTQANLEVMINSLQASGVSRIVVVGNHYLNWAASAGDTLATPYASWATLRAAQAAAASAQGVVFCDVYTYFRNLIVAGTETQGSYSWHPKNSDVHLNATGNQYVANAVLATIQAQSGWVEALT